MIAVYWLMVTGFCIAGVVQMCRGIAHYASLRDAESDECVWWSWGLWLIAFSLGVGIVVNS
jgi:hypothetical protein